MANNLLPSEEQLKMRGLIERLSYEEVPLEGEDLRQLQHFVKVVRYEIVETPSVPAKFETFPNGDTVEIAGPVGGGIKRVNYHMLNDRGLKLKFQWEQGLLDKHLD